MLDTLATSYKAGTHRGIGGEHANNETKQRKEHFNDHGWSFSSHQTQILHGLICLMCLDTHETLIRYFGKCKQNY